MEFLRKSYLFSLNERKRKADLNIPVRCLFPSSSRKRYARCRNNVNFDNLEDMEPTFNCINNYITDDIKSESYHI